MVGTVFIGLRHLISRRSARLFNAKNELGSTPKLPQLDKSRSLASESSNTSSDRAPGTDGGYTSIESYGSSDPTDEYQAKSEKKSANPSDQVGSRSPMRGPRLFSEAFALGCSIAFRWAAVSIRYISLEYGLFTIYRTCFLCQRTNQIGISLRCVWLGAWRY